MDFVATYMRDIKTINTEVSLMEKKYVVNLTLSGTPYDLKLHRKAVIRFKLKRLWFSNPSSFERLGSENVPPENRIFPWIKY